MGADYETFRKWMAEQAGILLKKMWALADSKKELHFVPHDPVELKPFYGTMEVSKAGNCVVTITRDEESWWLKKGKEICLDFGDYQDYDVIPVD